jgi:hypothetical protein
MLVPSLAETAPIVTLARLLYTVEPTKIRYQKSLFVQQSSRMLKKKDAIRHIHFFSSSYSPK